jgi:hypothetical protein
MTARRAGSPIASGRMDVELPPDHEATAPSGGGSTFPRVTPEGTKIQRSSARDDSTVPSCQTLKHGDAPQTVHPE